MPGPETLTLAQRMVQARERTAADREVRTAQRAAPVRAGTAAPLKTATAAPSKTAAAAPAKAAAAARPAAAHAGSWIVKGQSGQALMLLPGQMHFGSQVASLRTLLGSCVAVTLWHPARRLGGMCHYLLPARQRKPAEPVDGRYGDEALEAMVQALKAAGTQPSDYHAHLYGGADTLPEGSGTRFNVGERNIEQGWSLLDQYGFQLQGVDVGEDVPRTVTLTLATGDVEMRRGAGKASTATR